MAYIVTENCIKCKYTDCVAVCPVDCFYEGKTMLAINPDECIDCGVCQPECPVEAIVPDTTNIKDLLKWQEINKKYSKVWPNITATKPSSPDSEKHKGEKNKYETYFLQEEDHID